MTEVTLLLLYEVHSLDWARLCDLLVVKNVAVIRYSRYWNKFFFKITLRTHYGFELRVKLSHSPSIDSRLNSTDTVYFCWYPKSMIYALIGLYTASEESRFSYVNVKFVIITK